MKQQTQALVLSVTEERGPLLQMLLLRFLFWRAETRDVLLTLNRSWMTLYGLLNIEMKPQSG